MHFWYFACQFTEFEKKQEIIWEYYFYIFQKNVKIELLQRISPNLQCTSCQNSVTENPNLVSVEQWLQALLQPIQIDHRW